MGNQVFEFGKIEFSLVTGLCFVLYTIIDDDPVSPFEDLFATRSSLIFSRLSSRLDEYAMMDPDNPFTCKLIVLYLIYNMVFVKDMNNDISFKSIRLFVVQAWVLKCLSPEYSSILTEHNDNAPLPKLFSWKTFLNTDYALTRHTIYDPEYVSVLVIYKLYHL
ncbi:hypothetical protein LIER_41515 [Lithospermum erythrorhizon]|uniref:Uncharacterized protein n=1 Tax=Lithospermum erythrorhizon TaxID=34254 RepID=A0AAV3RDP2_LITER